MVFKCKECGNVTMRVYSSKDGKKKDICSICLANYEKEKSEIDDVIRQEKIDKYFDKKLEQLKQIFSSNESRFYEHEEKMGKLEKRIEMLESKLNDETKLQPKRSNTKK